mmetsp:Transcript_3417/g.8018  ORF Transcript_3417/g.8018 Transcript_3417/m.8018 type:complete len:310 (-) Transcript_3417:180-1109(-)
MKSAPLPPPPPPPPTTTAAPTAAPPGRTKRLRTGGPSGSIDRLPSEAYVVVARYLDDLSVLHLAGTCKKLRGFATGPALWKERCRARLWRYKDATKASSSAIREQRWMRAYFIAEAQEQKIVKALWEERLAASGRRFDMCRHFLGAAPHSRWHGWKRRRWIFIRQYRDYFLPARETRPLTIVAQSSEGVTMATFPVRKSCCLTIVTPDMLARFNQNPNQEQNPIASTFTYMCMISGMPFDLIWGTNEKETFHAWCRIVYGEIHFLGSGKERIPRAKYTFDGIERKSYVRVTGDCCDHPCDEILNACGCD